MIRTPRLPLTLLAIVIGGAWLVFLPFRFWMPELMGLESPASFWATNAHEALIAQARDTPKPLGSHGVEVPADLEAAMFACLAKEPDDRPPSARDRLEALDIPKWTQEQAADSSAEDLVAPRVESQSQDTGWLEPESS